jgi:hypothetical protein
VNFIFRKRIDAEGPWIFIAEIASAIIIYCLLRRWMKSEFRGHRIFVALILTVFLDALMITIPCQLILLNKTQCDRREYFQITFHGRSGQYRVSDGVHEQWIYLPNDRSIPYGVVKDWSVECCFIDCYLDIHSLSETKFYGK